MNIEKIDLKYRHNLELSLECDRYGKTISRHQYTSYPLRLSTPFYLDAESKRVYHYLIDTSPGLLAGDKIDLSLQLAANTSLHLTERAATKVHQMPKSETKAVVNYQITVDADASLEIVLEPVILYLDAVLEQKTVIKLHPTANLWLTDMIMPGRLAKNEFYEFNYYLNRLAVTDLAGQLLFADASRLVGKKNPFKHHKLFTSEPIIGKAIAVLPETNLDSLMQQLESISVNEHGNLEVATTTLPGTNGILIRVTSNKTSSIKSYFTAALNCIRDITNQPSLPYIPK